MPLVKKIYKQRLIVAFFTDILFFKDIFDRHIDINALEYLIDGPAVEFITWNRSLSRWK